MIVQALHELQHEHGYLPADQLRALAARIGEPLHRLHEVASFFPHFPFAAAARGARSESAATWLRHMAGGKKLGRRLDELAKQSPGQIAVERVSCLGRCDAGPAVSINDQVYWNKSPAEIESIIQAAVARQPLPAQTTNTSKPRWQIDPYDDRPHLRAHSPLGRRLERLDTDADAARKLPATRRSDSQARSKVISSNSGQPRFPQFRKWATVRGAAGDVKYVVCNGDESEPGTFKDRDLLLFASHLLIEGITIAGLVSGAERGYIYIRHEYHEQIEAVRNEIARAEREGYCGANILGSGLSFPVEVFVSPGGYICGEEKRALGGDGRPPGRAAQQAAAAGIRGTPWQSRPSSTTWRPCPGSRPLLLLRGGTWYRGLGTHGAMGMRFVSISGHVARPGVYEVPFGQTVRELICDTAVAACRGSRQKLKAIATERASRRFFAGRRSIVRQVSPKFVEGFEASARCVAADADDARYP